MYLLQCWFNLSDEGVEDAVYDSYTLDDKELLFPNVAISTQKGN